MTNAITKHEYALPYVKRDKATDEEIMAALAPAFAMFPNAKVTDEMLGLYRLLLRDVDANSLACAVLEAIKVCKFLPTVAEIREHIAKREPGPSSSQADQNNMKPVPSKMYRPSKEEDKKQRMAQLRTYGGH